MGMPTAIKALAVVCLLAAPRVALAQTELKNDGFVDNESVGFQAGFVAGEIGASKFIAPAPGLQVTAVRFLFGGAPGTHDITLRIYENPGTGDAPGTEVFSGDYTVTASDDSMQEIELTADDVFVTGNFRVGIELTHNGLPSIARDTDGTIAADRNFLYASGLGWYRSADLGLVGDWIIRAEVTGGGALPDAGLSPDAGEVPDAGSPDATVAVDAGLLPDGGTGGCAGNADCDEGEYCNVAAGVCTFDCRTDDDCASGNTCNSLGMCVAGGDDGGGCGCATTETSRGGNGGGGGGWIFLAGAVGLALRPRRRR
jgi:hypothetical protein